MNGNKKVLLSPRKILTLFSLGFAQNVIFLMPYISYAFYKPLQQSLNCSNAQIGFLLSVMGIAEISSYLPGGWIADRFDPKKLVLISLTLMGIMICTCAIYPNYNFYFIMWIFMGVDANLIYWSASMKSVRLNTEPNEQGKAYGYFYAFKFGTASLTNAIGAALVGYATYVTLGFKYVVVLYGLLNFIAAIVVWKILPSTKEEVEIIEANKSINKSEKITFKDVKSILKRKETWLVSIIAFSLYTMLSLPSYFTPYFGDVMHLSVASAAIIYVLTGPLSALLGPIMGTISDFIGSTIKTISYVMCLTVILLTVMLVSTGHLTLAGAIAIDAIMTSISVGIYSITFACIEELGFDRRMAGTCIGVASIIAYTPDVFMFSLFGSWLDTYKNAAYSKIFIYGLVMTLIGLAAALVLQSIIKNAKILKIKNTQKDIQVN